MFNLVEYFDDIQDNELFPLIHLGTYVFLN